MGDQVRFEMCAQALSPTIKCVAPWRDAEFIESFKGRSDLLGYCEKHGIPVDAKPKANYSIDENLFHTSYESGCLEDAACGPEESMFKMTVSPQAVPDSSETVVIEFVKGIPVKITNKTDNTVKTDPLEIFLYCNAIAGKHGIGRIDIVENRFVGIKSRGVYETPGGTLLREAHMDLEGICMDREVKRITEVCRTNSHDCVITDSGSHRKWNLSVIPSRLVNGMLLVKSKSNCTREIVSSRDGPVRRHCTMQI